MNLLFRKAARSARPSSGCRRAFSLIELLVVVGLVGLLSAPIALALRGGGAAVSLRSAQNLVSSLLVSARNQAALSRANVRLIVYSNHDENTDVDRRLRHLQIVVETPDGKWRPAGEGVLLPKEACIVPKSLPPTAAGVEWGSSPVSSFSGDVELAIATGGITAHARYFYVEFTPLGNTSAATFVLSPASVHSSSGSLNVRFTRPADVRGIKLSQYGAQTFLPDLSAF